MGARNLGSLAGCLSYKVSHETSIKLLTGTAVSSEGLNGRGSAPKLPHMVLGKI